MLFDLYIYTNYKYAIFRNSSSNYKKTPRISKVEYKAEDKNKTRSRRKQLRAAKTEKKDHTTEDNEEVT